MNTVNIYSDKRKSKPFVTSIVILLIVSIFMVIFGSKLRTREAVIQAALTIFIVVMINIIKDITDARNYKASLKIKKYVNLKTEIISYAGLATIAILAIILVPFSITLLGVLGVFAFGFILGYEVFKILNKKPLLILKKDGFIDRSILLSIGEIRYIEVKDVFIFTRRGNKQLVIVIDGLEEKVKKLPLFKRLLYRHKKYITIPENRLDIPLEKLAGIIIPYANLNPEEYTL